MAHKALDRAYARVARMISNRAMSMSEIIMSDVASREIIMSYIKQARQSGEVSMRYRENGEPEYSR